MTMFSVIVKSEKGTPSLPDVNISSLYVKLLYSYSHELQEDSCFCELFSWEQNFYTDSVIKGLCPIKA